MFNSGKHKSDLGDNFKNFKMLYVTMLFKGRRLGTDTEKLSSDLTNKIETLVFIYL